MHAEHISPPIACVTGAASGIGRAIAIRLSEAGFRLFIADMDRDGGNETVSLITKKQGEASFLNLDVTDESAWANAIRTIDTESHGLRVLVNNAGICIHRGLLDTSLETWRKIQSINLDGVFLGMQHAIPLMAREGGGSIVNISSVAGIRGIPGMVAYCASKAGVIGATRSVAMECAQLRNNIRVNAVLPGAIETPIWAKLGNDGTLPASSSAYESAMAAQREGARSATPVGVPGSALDIASMVAFLVSSEARFITGSEFIVDGGASASA